MRIREQVRDISWKKTRKVIAVVTMGGERKLCKAQQVFTCQDKLTKKPQQARCWDQMCMSSTENDERIPVLKQTLDTCSAQVQTCKITKVCFPPINCDLRPRLNLPTARRRYTFFLPFFNPPSNPFGSRKDDSTTHFDKK